MKVVFWNGSKILFFFTQVLISEYNNQIILFNEWLIAILNMYNWKKTGLAMNNLSKNCQIIYKLNKQPKQANLFPVKSKIGNLKCEARLFEKFK